MNSLQSKEQTGSNVDGKSEMSAEEGRNVDIPTFIRSEQDPRML